MTCLGIVKKGYNSINFYKVKILIKIDYKKLNIDTYILWNIQ
jgi:hypothetical protein